LADCHTFSMHCTSFLDSAAHFAWLVSWQQWLHELLPDSDFSSPLNTLPKTIVLTHASSTYPLMTAACIFMQPDLPC